MGDSFVFYDSFLASIEFLPEEEQLKAFKAITAYALRGELPEESGLFMAVFSMAKPLLDANAERRRNGSKGGRPTAEKPTEKADEKPMVIENAENEKPMVIENAENEKPNVNVNVNVNVNDNDNKNTISCDDQAKKHQHQMLQEQFERFWSAYPKKTGKKTCSDKWMRIKPDDALVDKMLKAIEEQKKSREWVEGYVPNPLTWLNQERWNDEIRPYNIAPANRQQPRIVQTGEQRDLDFLTR